MKILDPLPPGLEEELSRQPEAEIPFIRAGADLNPDGRYGEQWLTVSEVDIRVYEPNGALPSRRHQIPLDQISGARQELLIGGSALIVDVGNEAIELIRYTNTHGRKFSRITRYLEEVCKYREAVEKNEEDAKKPELEDDPDEPKHCPQCDLLLPEGTRVCPACLHKGKVLVRTSEYLRPYWRQTVTVWALMLLGVGLDLVSPYLTRPLMDVVLAPQHPAAVEYRGRVLGWLVLAMLGTRVLAQGLAISRGRLVIWLGGRLSHDLRTQVYQHLQLLPLKYFDKRQTGAIMSRVTQDTDSLENVLVDGAQFFVVNVLQLIGITAILFWINWRLSLLILIPAPGVMIMSRVFWPRMFDLWNRFWHFRQRLSASLNDSLSGIRVVRAFAQEGQEIDRFNSRSEDLRISNLAAERAFNSYFPIISLLMGLGSLFVWYVGGLMVLRHTMSLGILMTFIAYLGMFYGPMQFISRAADWLARSLAAAGRVFEVLDSDSDVQDAEDAVDVDRIEGRVEFKNVVFGYDRHKPVLKGVSFTAEPGEMIGFVGHSGAGKSTSINLICRFYDTQSGELLIDGKSIRKIRQQDLRSQIGVVLQDTFLFNGSILENISYARPGSTREEIMAAARAAYAHEFIVKKPDGYDTVVGERGQALSGGERQRISIARAILHNPRILILDEATSSVDTDTEKQIQDAIARLVKGRTTFAIAHRLSTLRNANRLIVLKDGKIEEMGTHDELLEKKGEFFRLVEMQQEMSRIKAVAR